MERSTDKKGLAKPTYRSESTALRGENLFST